MSKTKNQKTKEIKSLNKTVENLHEKNETRKDNNTGAINDGNLINSGRSRRSTELHTKTTVLGSDSDGQAN
jgi:hypothetical protein